MGFRSIMTAAVATLSLLSACGASPQPEVTAVSFEKNFVQVELSLTVAADGTARLTGTFLPEPGWHLYSTDLAMTGVDGLGRPTRMDVVGGALATGAPQVSVEAYELPIPALDTSVPVYPDGPVTLTSDIELSDGTVEVDVTYMACAADGGCRIPVVGHRVGIALP